MRFADPAEAGFDAAQLEAARQTWETMPSSAFMVIADGAVVAAWGDVERRFMCHSVRKSLLSALYGIYWDRGQIELNKTLADLGLDDEAAAALQALETDVEILVNQGSLGPIEGQLVHNLTTVAQERLSR